MFWILLWVIVSLFVGNNTGSNELSSQVGEAIDLSGVGDVTFKKENGWRY